MKNLKESYKKLQEKYKLPDYEELDQEFELLYMKEIYEITRPLVFIRRRIYDKIGWSSGMIQSILQPNPSSPINLEESSFFTKEEKQEKLIKLLRQMMYYARLSLDLDISSTDEEEAEFIKEAFNKWQEFKPAIKEISTKMKEGWKKEIEHKKGHDYMG